MRLKDSRGNQTLGSSLQSLIEADVWGALNYVFWGACNWLFLEKNWGALN